MTPEQTALAREWTAEPGFRWMPGMLAHEWSIPGQMLSLRPFRLNHAEDCAVGTWIPDVTDPATIGCLVALVREITGARLTCSDPLPSACVVLDWPDGQEGYHFGATISEALLRAAQAVGR